MIHCNCLDSVATSFSTTVTNGLWCYFMYHLCKTVVANVLRPCNMPSASHTMLLYCQSTLDRLSLANATGHRVALSVTSTCPQFMPSVTCHNPAPKPSSKCICLWVQGFQCIIKFQSGILFNYLLRFAIQVLIYLIPWPFNLYWCDLPQWLTDLSSCWWKLT